VIPERAVKRRLDLADDERTELKDPRVGRQRRVHTSARGHVVSEDENGRVLRK
jgi:hypothetical protein